MFLTTAEFLPGHRAQRQQAIHIITAARQRSAATRRRANAGLRRLHAAGRPVSFEALAREAQVSRSWLYSQPGLRAEIERLRGQPKQPARPAIPDRQRATEASLRSRLELTAQRVRQFEADNRRLRRDTPKRQSPPGITPSRTPSSWTPAGAQTPR